MFRRKRSASNPVRFIIPIETLFQADDSKPRPGSTTPSAAAALAASQAFLANRASNANLSASAAAAALRSHTASPIPVGQVQTKRMQRRESVTSVGSVPTRPGGLQRRGSGGSMTDRTFREPSPSRPERPASSHGPYPKYSDDVAPPVPLVPQRYASPSPLPRKQGTHPASVESSPSNNPASPRASAGRNTRPARGHGSAPASKILTSEALDVERVGQAQQAANQATNRSSVNFSRPMSPQNTPITASPNEGRVRSPPPEVETSGRLRPNPLDNPAGSPQNPPAKTKMSLQSIGAEDAPLKPPTVIGGLTREETSASPSQGSADRLAPRAVPEFALNQTLGPLKAKKKKKKMTAPAGMLPDREQNEGFGNAYPSDTESVLSDVSSTTDRSRKSSARSTGFLTKQPSIVREDREGEEKEEPLAYNSKFTPKNAKVGAIGTSMPANSSKAVSKQPQHAKSSSLPGKQHVKDVPSLEVPSASRPTSLSPSRAAHFSAQPVYDSPDGTKHQPPARSVSPAKSALKYSPSRGQSPAISRSKGRKIGETSDTGSALSEDGERLSEKMRKTARVSFDDTSISVGQAADAVPSDSPVILSPQDQSKPEYWNSLSDNAMRSNPPEVEQGDELIQPTPVLPHFGSVRTRREQAEPALTKPIVASTDQGMPNPTERQTSSASSAGAPVSQDATANEVEASIPVPPGPTSDIQQQGSSTLTKPASNHVVSSNQPSVEGKTLGTAVTAVQGQTKDIMPEAVNQSPHAREPTELSSGLVPSISVLPATPGIESTNDQNGWLGMPGGFPGPGAVPSTKPEEGGQETDAAAESLVAHEVSPPTQTTDRPSTPVTPATVGIAEPEPPEAASQHEAGSPHVGEVADALRTQIDPHSGEESADDGSIYSDAAEDQSENEGDGFGSINAIVESPASPDFSVPAKPPPSSPTPNSSEELSQRLASTNQGTEDAQSPHGGDWDRAQAYWSGLSQARKQQLEHAALPGAVDERIIPDRTMRGNDSVVKRKKKTKTAQPPVKPNDVPTTAAGTQKLKSIASAGQSGTYEARPRSDAESSAKRSAKLPPPRSGPGGMKQSTNTQSAGSKDPLRGKARATSAVPMIDYSRDPTIVTTGPATAGSGTQPKASLTPVNARQKRLAPRSKVTNNRSNDSDSDSSFKRVRASTPDTGRYQMKRTMRSQSTSKDASQYADRAGSLTSRTASPAIPGGRRPFSAVGPGGGMRTSMRSSLDAGKSKPKSLRNSIDSTAAGRTKSPSRFSFGLGSKPKIGEGKSAETGPLAQPSRFGDSSDEELPPMRSSRFEDSSDDDEPDSLAPVRGIPRRIDEGDSTDLEDSSTENVGGPTRGKSNDTQPTSISARSALPEGHALASGSLRVAPGDEPATSGMGMGLQAKKAAEKDRKKRSFFGGLGSRRKDEASRTRQAASDRSPQLSAPMGSLQEVAVPSPAATPSKKAAAVGMGSPSTMGTSQPSSAQASPKPPKLQRRHTPRRLTSTGDVSWPSGKPAGQAKSAPVSRPRTSDGPGPKSPVHRPDAGGRRVTEQGARTVISKPTDGAVKAEKKRKFPMLRKAFGLHA